MPRASELLNRLMEMPENENFSVGDFVTQLGSRSFVLAILIFALPHSVPLPEPPGLSTITALPVLFMAAQIVIGRQTIWLPKSIARKHISQKSIKGIIRKVLSLIIWLERFMHSRWPFLYGAFGQRTIGFLIFLMALILALPIPGGNFLPGLSISFLALALLEGDGAFTLFSILFSAASFYVMYQLVILAASELIKYLL